MKTTYTHTPGPWKMVPSSNPRNGTLWRDIVSTGTHFSPSYVGEALEQDARLICAAPDLLSACKQALDLLRDPESDWPDADKVEAVLIAAISKAERGEG